MQILYISSLCTTNTYQRMFADSSVKPSQAAQKYHRLMIEGIAASGQHTVKAISALPISRRISSRIFFHRENEKCMGVEYIYLPFINLPILRQCALFYSVFFTILQLVWQNRDSFVICDVLNIAVAQGALLAAKLGSICNIGIVTDIPTFLTDNIGYRRNLFAAILLKLIRKINTKTITGFESFLFLTALMNERLNKKNRPYVVIEGQVDVTMQQLDNILDDKYYPMVCLYAGTVEKIYGLPMLVEAFLQVSQDGIELHIYGNGDYQDELQTICQYHPQIRYFGVVDNSRVVEEELKATLLINPRPSHDEYTKYSFPSKNMEYMVSGTPVLTTKLPGMPAEYNEYVYLIEDETVYGLASILTTLLSKPREELHEKGLRAKEFVLAKKNNVIQAQKVLDLLQECNELRVTNYKLRIRNWRSILDRIYKIFRI